MTLAFIVNCFEDHDKLLCCLASIATQWKSTKFNIETHVADNSTNEAQAEKIRFVCNLFENVTYHKTEGHCYTAADALAPTVEADWICFASSDGYYVPGFSAIMLETADRLGSDLVYCDMLYDPRLHGRGIYSVLNTFPEICFIDKTCFILKKELFKGFPLHDKNWRDGLLVENLKREGAKIDKAKGCLVVHN